MHNISNNISSLLSTYVPGTMLCKHFTYVIFFNPDMNPWGVVNIFIEKESEVWRDEVL